MQDDQLVFSWMPLFVLLDTYGYLRMVWKHGAIVLNDIPIIPRDPEVISIFAAFQ